MKVVCVFVILLLGLTLACTVTAPPAPAPEIKAPLGGSVAKTGWEQKWESTLAEARKEGIVRVYTLWGPNITIPLSKAFQQKYGIELEFANVGRGSALLPKVEAENRAGLYLADALGFGATTLLTTVKPAGLMGTMEPLLILPEVTDPKVWAGGGFPWVDKDRTTVGMLSVLQRYILYNTDLVKEGEISAYKDLLKPQYKGKITMGDPSLTGTTNGMFGHLAFQLWTVEEATDFMRRLIIDQEAMVVQEHRFVTEWVARGKYLFGVGGEQQSVTEFMKLGAPISLAVQKEGHPIKVTGGALGVAKRIPHPNAATIFVNWLLTKEGQTIFANNYGYPSPRLDVTIEGIHPLLVVKSGEKYFMESEDEILKRGPLSDVAKKILESVRK
ncbi:MAG: extracellular solute-binding protein [Chloroflexi bacterium]|nr:extracellular solute-binding protein [Chloroflexota bacterium]